MSFLCSNPGCSGERQDRGFSAGLFDAYGLSRSEGWGIDDIVVRETASGSLIRFSYRVVDAEKAKILSDKKAAPYLIDEKDGLALQIPELEQVGQLRQVATPQNGREYWMAFSNKGRQVKAGSHVTVMIGLFRAEGLVVTGQSTFASP